LTSRPPETAGSAPFGPLVSGDWLEGHLGGPDLVVLDASCYLPTSGRDAFREYQERHIPGAVFFDLDRASDPASPWPHMFPGAEPFARYIGSLGVGSTARVVVYDGSGANLSAARAWWMLRMVGHREVGILDGGLVKWCAEGRATRSGTEAPLPATFLPSRREPEIATRDEVKEALARGAVRVVDVRAADRFRGTAPEPRPGIRSGHMPGAVNLPYTELHAADGTLLGQAELRRRLLAAGVDPGRPIIATCGSGTSACALLLALEVLGTGGHRLYDGAWTEWAGSGMPVVTSD